ncbi:MAG: type III pantothenate kinase [Flavobacteriaceae bacterium]|nr:type III pantothenate kinase [Flavobacteriaceae bacterium]
MNLVIDIGNNYFKLAVFGNETLMYSKSGKSSVLEEIIPRLIEDFPKIKFSLISNVSNVSDSIIKKILRSKEIKIFDFASSLKLPFTVKYKTIETLGNDRLALVAAAVKLYPDSNNIIIDAGTCLTADFISDKNIYFGGMISPGIEMRYKSLKNYTAKLPKLKKSNNFKFPADSTSGSIHAGVVGGVLNEISGFIKQLINKYKKVNIILTGGDAEFLSKTLKITIFANQNFILEGLNSILNLNKH